MWEFWRGKLGSKGRSSPRTTASPTTHDAQRRAAAVVNFKDLNLSVDDELSEDAQMDAGYQEDEDPTNKFAIIRTKSLRSGAQKNKLIIIMVGLPGRGKTFLCNKLKCYLNWLGHNTAHFNVGNYRRQQKGAHEVQDAAFFDAHNQHGVEARCRALMAAIDDVMRFLAEGGQVAIFDATNTTKERRQLLINTFHGRCQYIFIESICNDSQVLEDNYRYKMKYSPDYQGVDTEAALWDFKQRIAKYNEVYKPIDDRRLHYIKLIDMVTGRGYMDVNRISGYIPGKIVFFLMQVCKAGMHAGQSRKIWLTRHGESQFNQAQRIGGDSGLTVRGEEYARLLADVLENRLPATFNESGVPVSVWTSTLRRTIATANHLPYPKLRWKALDEIHAGVCDGMTYAEIAAKFPEDYEARKRDKLRYRYPSGESYLDVIQRLEPVIIEMEREREYICVVGHQAVLRAIFGYFMAVPLDTIPRLDIPLHTLIELQPRADGTMEVTFLPVPVPTAGPSSSAHHHHHHHHHHQHHKEQQQQQQQHKEQQQQAQPGSTPPSGGGLTAALGGALSGLRPLVSHNSLPSGFLGMRGSPRASRSHSHSNSSSKLDPTAAAAGAGGGGSSGGGGGSGSSGGGSPLHQRGGGGGGAHRRTASGTPLAGPYGTAGVQYGTVAGQYVMHQSPSFATVSSMGSYGPGGTGMTGSSSQGSLGGSSTTSGHHQQHHQQQHHPHLQQQQEGPVAGSTPPTSGGGVGPLLPPSARSSRSGSSLNPAAAAAAGAGAAAAGAAAAAAGSAGPLHGSSGGDGGLDGGGSSSSHPQAGEAEGAATPSRGGAEGQQQQQQQRLLVQQQQQQDEEDASDLGLNPWGEHHKSGGHSAAAAAAAAVAAAPGATAGAVLHSTSSRGPGGHGVAEQLQLQGLALQESVVLTSAAAAAGGGGGGGPIGSSGSGGVGDGGGSSSCASSDAGSSGTPQLGPVLGSMNSLD